MNAKTEAAEVESATVEKIEFKFQIAQLLAGVAAAVAAALIGSRLGVQGTLIGAAVTAVVAGMVSQFATFGFQRTHAGLQFVISRRNPSEADADEPAVVASGATAVRAAASAQAKRGRRVHWGLALGGVALSAIVTFGITMGVLTIAESAAGRSVDGGYSTTVGGVAGKATVEQPDAPIVISTATASPTPAPVSASPTPDASPSPLPLPTLPPTPTSTTPAPATTTAAPVTPAPVATTASAPSAAPQPASP